MGLLLFKGQCGIDKSELGANCAYYLSRARNYYFEQGESWGFNLFLYIDNIIAWETFSVS